MTRKRTRSSKGSGAKRQPRAEDRPTHSPEGVDLTLIRWFLTLTPLERLQTLENQMKSVQAIRDANPNL
jgi:hypothetical protein